MASESLLNQLRQSFYNSDGSANERLDKYCSKDIKKIIIDGNEFTGYKTYSFFWEKTYVKEPERSASGVIDNLNAYATFVTPHLQINYSLMSIEDYRRLYQLIISKNEFTVTCYDVINNEQTTNNMYFYPDSLPKLNLMARNIFNPNGQKEKWVELLGVQDYTVEMVGTNTNFNLQRLVYRLNKPSNAEWDYFDQAEQTFRKNTSVVIGESSKISVDNTLQSIQSITFGDKYSFVGWNTKEDGTGLTYIDKEAYYLQNTLILYAQWKTK